MNIYNFIYVITDMIMFNLYVFTLMSIIFEFTNITNYPQEFNTTTNHTKIIIHKYFEHI